MRAMVALHQLVSCVKMPCWQPNVEQLLIGAVDSDKIH